MKKLLKVLGVIAGGYAIWNTLCLAWIGAGRIVRRCTENYPNESFMESDDVVVKEAINDWKILFRRLKEEA